MYTRNTDDTMAIIIPESAINLYLISRSGSPSLLFYFGLFSLKSLKNVSLLDNKVERRRATCHVELIRPSSTRLVIDSYFYR